MWSSAAYFISPSKETSIISASTYKGIINGEGTSLESASINTWFKDETTKSINAYLRHFTHPRFHDKDFLIDLSATPDITPSTMLSTKELSVQCSVPYKSIPEAHNLLKKTSPEESAEGFNLQGKSVEMISNAIAEMRTYGEGFIIVDQAPGLLDMSAIRNTNTKIIFHLPDMGDRELVGRAAGLSDDQLTELAKIPSGVAAIYQNRWVEPVLCNVDYYNIQPTEYFYSKETDDILDNAYIRAKVASHLVSIISGQNDNINVRKLKHWLISSDIDSATKLEVLKILDLKSNIKKTNVEKIIANIVDRDKKAFEIAKDADSIEEWNETLIRNLDMDISVINDTSIENILECLIHYRSLEHASDEENFFKWMNYMGRRRL